MLTGIFILSALCYFVGYGLVLSSYFVGWPYGMEPFEASIVLTILGLSGMTCVIAAWDTRT